ncbi:MAG: hypothetical protein BGO90_02980 [Legionella sp. 40-6]|nr:MAG: hypothetical protein BGO90_02980 [Legionella sp. 40-6]
MKQYFQESMSNIKQRLLKKKLSFFSQRRYDDYLNAEDINEGLSTLLQLYPFKNVFEKTDDSLPIFIQKWSLAIEKAVY